MSFGAVETYRNLPAGKYGLAVLPAGSTPGAAFTSLFTGPQMKFPSGSVRTIVLLDRAAAELNPGQVSPEPSPKAMVQAIVNEDGESGTK